METGASGSAMAGGAGGRQAMPDGAGVFSAWNSKGMRLTGHSPGMPEFAAHRYISRADERALSGTQRISKETLT